MKTALAAASCAILVGTAGAQVVMFENFDEEFAWYKGAETIDLPGNIFDITQGPSQPITFQTVVGRSVGWSSKSKYSSSDYSFSGFSSRVSRGPSETYPYPYTGTGDFTFAGLPQLSIGDVIGPDMDFGPPSGSNISYVAKMLWLDSDFFDYRSTEFLGVRIEIEGNTHYGWIQLGEVYQSQSPFPDLSGIPPITDTMHPLRWAYELQPDTPIEIAPTCRPDLNGDGVVDADDFFLFLQLFAAGDARADFNNDGVIDADDFFAFLNAFAAGCP